MTRCSVSACPRAARKDRRPSLFDVIVAESAFAARASAVVVQCHTDYVHEKMWRIRGCSEPVVRARSTVITGCTTVVSHSFDDNSNIACAFFQLRRLWTARSTAAIAWHTASSMPHMCPTRPRLMPLVCRNPSLTASSSFTPSRGFRSGGKCGRCAALLGLSTVLGVADCRAGAPGLAHQFHLALNQLLHFRHSSVAPNSLLSSWNDSSPDVKPSCRFIVCHKSSYSVQVVNLQSNAHELAHRLPLARLAPTA